MSQTEHTEVTRLLSAMRAGDDAAGARIFPLVYEELRRAAGRILSTQRRDHTLAPTDLVHEAWLRLGFKPDGGPNLDANDRSHFLGITIRAMRQVLIDHARRRGAAKRQAGTVRVTLDENLVAGQSSPDEMLALFDALDRLGDMEPRLRTVVEYRHFAGLTEEETAELLGITARTVQRDWVKARAWLYTQLYASETDA
jgi:RNA polymerase sigma factor (TIGR02999 family)